MFNDYDDVSTGIGDPIKIPLRKPLYTIHKEARVRTMYETL